MKFNISKEWLKKKIEEDSGDCEIGAGLPIETVEDLDAATDYLKAHVNSKEQNDG